MRRMILAVLFILILAGSAFAEVRTAGPGPFGDIRPWGAGESRGVQPE